MQWEYCFLDWFGGVAGEQNPRPHLVFRMAGRQPEEIERVRVEDFLAGLGGDGWEIIGFASPAPSVERYVLKRPIRD